MSFGFRQIQPKLNRRNENGDGDDVLATRYFADSPERRRQTETELRHDSLVNVGWMLSNLWNRLSPAPKDG